ncbi:MAG: hypothetical protein JNK05_33855 [Myxococcales bacterium]|nr:hypothetical protein [Myxococcales bacterium]
MKLRLALISATLVVATTQGALALCMMPRPEPPRLLQSESVAIAPGDAFAMYLSSASQTSLFSLRPTVGASRTPVPVSASQVVPFVYRAVVPSRTEPGVYEVLSAASPRATAQVVGRITVAQQASARAATAVQGRLRLDTATSVRRGSTSVLRFELSDRNLADVVVLFRWRVRGRQLGNAVWVTADRALFVAAAGRCGPSPYDSGGAPPAGTTVEVAQLGRDGTPGPFTSYVVR